MRAERARASAAFTLVEVLLVLAILAVVAVIAMPSVGTMLAGGNLRSGARALASAGRYARSMALLVQTPVDLEVNLDEGSFKVRAKESSDLSRLGMSDVAAITNSIGYTEELMQTSARRSTSLGGGFGLAVSENDRDSGAYTNALEAARAAFAESGKEGNPDILETVSLEDSVNFEHTAAGVKFKFDGFRDSASSKRDKKVDESQEEGSKSIRYRANGTVRPHRWIVYDADNPSDKLYITVNAVGRYKICEEGQL